MAEVFISYKREDKETAKKIAEALALYGFQVWWDIDLLPGDEFIDEINEMIDGAKATIVLWSELSVGSKFVKAEAKKAWELDSFVPVLISQGIDIPVPFNTTHSHDLTDWDGEPIPIQDNLRSLIGVIETRTGKMAEYTPQSKEEVERRLSRYEAEVDFWKKISDKPRTSAEDYSLYLRRYGEVGQFSHLAQKRLQKITRARSRMKRRLSALVAIAAAGSLAYFNRDAIVDYYQESIDQEARCESKWVSLEDSIRIKDFDRFLDTCQESPNFFDAKLRRDLLARWLSGAQTDPEFSEQVLDSPDIYPGLRRDVQQANSVLSEQDAENWAEKVRGADLNSVRVVYDLLDDNPPAPIRTQLEKRLERLDAVPLPDSRSLPASEMAPVLSHPGQLRPYTAFRDCEDCPEMVVVEAGAFTMGSASGRPDERPPHQVDIPNDFAIGRFEITHQNWAKCANAGFCENIDSEKIGSERHPVAHISWEDIQGDGGAKRGYIAWLNSRLDRPDLYRLPSEAEWEYVAKHDIVLGSGLSIDPEFPNETSICEYANHLDSSLETNRYGIQKSDCSDGVAEGAGPVGLTAPNVLGLFDLFGNVNERVADCRNRSYDIPDRLDDGSPRLSGDCDFSIVKGGGWFTPAENTRPSFRHWSKKEVSASNYGFRLVREIR